MSASRMPTLRPVACRPERQVDGGRRLADAAFAGGDRDQAFDARHRRHRARARAARCAAAPVAAGARLADARAFGHLGAGSRRAPRTASAVSTAVTPETPGTLATTVSAAWRSGSSSSARVGRHRDREIDAVVLDQDFGDEPEIDDVAVEVGSLDPAQLVENLRLGYGHLNCSRGRAGADRRSGRHWCEILSEAALEVTSLPSI